jgi:hypothetical protein
MSWDAEPATEKQLNYLKLFGYEPDQPLTKQAAHDLIDKFEKDPERRRIRGENQARESAVYEKERRENLAYYLHTDCDTLAKALANASDKEDRFYAKDELKLKQDERIEFWKDTFRDVGDRKGESLQAYEFYENFGQFVKVPTNDQIKGLLAALDKYSPTWDLDRPTDFFHTLKLNFPELLHK